jgi:3-methyl-2-oxobutanoate hydroxymethyltransferase
MEPKVTVRTLQAAKRTGRRLAMVTCYDATFGRLVDESGVDVVLVGDSLGMVIQGLPNTLAVTLDEVIYHCRAVSRGVRRAHLVGDMPFGSYQPSPEEAMRSATRMLKEGGVEAVKLEGGVEMAETVTKLVSVGIPVMGHVGLTPQSVHAMGGFRVQGRDEDSAARIVDGARALEEAGAYSVVLEGMPTDVATRVTASLSIPTIGIGAGPSCDGQVLVLYDLLGLPGDATPRFVRRFEELGLRTRAALARYVEDVRSGAFPTVEESYSPETRLSGHH